jgi:hypothetical protein
MAASFASLQSSVVIDNLNLQRVVISPPEVGLFVDANAHLPGAVTLDDLEPVARRVARARGGPGRIELTQFPQKLGFRSSWDKLK